MAAPSDQPEPAVLPSVAAGDAEAATELWNRYSARVRSLGLRLSGHDARFADDLVQETFAKLWRYAGTFDARRGTEATFVFTVARRAAVDQWRRTRRASGDRPLDDVLDVAARTGADQPGASDDGEAVDAILTGWIVSEALTVLPAIQREVIDLAYFGQLSQSEIATRLGIPLGTVKTRTFAALRALRGELAGKGVMA